MAQSGPPSAGGSVPPPPSRNPSSRTLLIVLTAVVVVVLVILLVLFSGVLPGPGGSSNGGSSGKTYVVTFAESGLSSRTEWSVILNGTERSSTNATITFSVPDGTYNYSIPAVAGYSTESGSSGQVIVLQDSPLVPVAFGATPLGIDFAWGTPVNTTGVPSTGCTGTLNVYCYSIEIAGAGGGVGTANILLSLRSAAGATVAWPGTPQVWLLSPTVSGHVAAYSTGTGSWTLVPPFAGAIEGGFSIVIQTSGVGDGAGLLGDQLVAIGQNGFSGSVPSNTFD